MIAAAAASTRPRNRWPNAISATAALGPPEPTSGGGVGRGVGRRGHRVRRRDFTAGLLLAGAARPVRAQERANQHRIAIVISAGSAASIDDPASRAWQAFWDELRRRGDIEGKNLTVERYSGEGRPEVYGDLAREVVSRNPDLI